MNELDNSRAEIPDKIYEQAQQENVFWDKAGPLREQIRLAELAHSTAGVYVLLPPNPSEQSTEEQLVPLAVAQEFLAYAQSKGEAAAWKWFKRVAVPKDTRQQEKDQIDLAHARKFVADKQADKKKAALEREAKIDENRYGWIKRSGDD